MTIGISLLAAITTFGQNTSRDFNDIKRSQKYYYYEITLATAEDSKEFATLELIKVINDSIGFSGERARPGVKEVTRADIGGVQYLEMDRPHGVRVMAYCPKSTFVQSPVATAKQPETKPEKPKPDIKQPATPQTGQSATPEAAGYEDWVLRDIDKLKQITSAEKFVQQLELMQAQHKIKRYGPADKCRNTDGSFWAVFDTDGTLTALLGPGSGMRKNFMSGTDVKLADYTDTNSYLVWFQFYK